MSGGYRQLNASEITELLGEESLSLTTGRDDLVILAPEALAGVKREMELPH
ncbi:hypothetical protein [Rhodoglobus sp.]